MATLRRSAVDLAGGAALDRLDDHAVLAVLSDAVAAGRLQLCRAQAGADASAEGAQEGPADIGVALKQTEGARAPTSAPRAAAAPRPPPPPPPPAPPAPAPPEIDGAAQAATLREAARSGVPFCAECEKARAAREAALA